MPLSTHLRQVARHNYATFLSSPLSEISGSLGDLGTLLPLMIALTLTGSISLPSTLVFSGLANILTGATLGIPLPVQPMKAIAAIAISNEFSKQETMAAGLTMGFAVLFLSITGLLGWLHRVVPVAVVKGIQVGAGLSLVIRGGSSLIKPLGWTIPTWDNRLWAIAAFLFLLIASIFPRRIPYALLVFTFGLILAATAIPPSSSSDLRLGFWHPHFSAPSRSAWKIGAIDAAIPQLPLTTLNSVLAVTSLAASLFPNDIPPTPSTTSIGLSVAVFNIVGCWFGAMPICHGSGGLAAQYRFGARSGSSIMFLGAIKLVLGLFVGDAIVPLLQRFPKGLLGIMVLAAGVELAKVGQSVGESRDLWERAEEDVNGGEARVSKESAEKERGDRWIVMLITVAGCLAFKNDAVGFLAGLVWHWGLKAPDLAARLWYGRGGSIRLGREEREEEGLLGRNLDAPESRLA